MSWLPISRGRSALYCLRRDVALLGRRRKFSPAEVVLSSRDLDFQQRWDVHDERWEMIRNRFEYRRRLREGREIPKAAYGEGPVEEVIFEEGGSIIFNGATSGYDEWLVVCAKEGASWGKNICWTFEIKKESKFRELQFDFRYKNLFHRARYRFEGDHVYFDLIKRGKSYHGLSKAHQALEVGRWYCVEIQTLGNEFRCSVDHRLLLVDFDFCNAFGEGTIAVILWENDGITDLRASLRNLVVRRMERGA